jgi:hypothetical protein
MHKENVKCIHILTGKPEGKMPHLGDRGVDGRITLNWILDKYSVKLRINYCGSG